MLEVADTIWAELICCMVQRLLSLGSVQVGVGTLTRNLKFCLNLAQLPPRQHLNVGAHLLACSRLARSKLDVPGYQLVPSVHLPFVGEDDLSSATRRVDRQRLVEGLLDLRSPDTFFSISAGDLLVVVELGGVVLGDLL